jgi:hypothetical protein
MPCACVWARREAEISFKAALRLLEQRCKIRLTLAFRFSRIISGNPACVIAFLRNQHFEPDENQE